MSQQLLQQIKDELAKEKGYKDFYTMQFPYDMVCEEDINVIATRYARVVAQRALEKAAETAKKYYAIMGYILTCPCTCKGVDVACVFSKVKKNIKQCIIWRMMNL